MPWVKVDDAAPHHPKLMGAGPIACWLWACGLCYCGRYLTNGFIPVAALSTLGNVPRAKKHADRLVEVGLWEWDAAREGFQVVNYLKYQPTREQAEKKREERRKAGAEGGRRSGEARSKREPIA